MNSADSNPFVGLRPFESHESLLFFGRQQQTVELLQRLHQFHFVALTGSSGSGKSSLIRAGLIPSLKAGYLVRNRDRWIIAMMKPGQTPLCNLAEAALNQSNLTSKNPGLNDFENRIKEEGSAAILDVLKPLWTQNNTNFFLLVDQFEELFRFSMNEKKPEKKDDAIDFVNILLELSANKKLPIYIVITMRSDFIGDCSQFYGLPEAINQSQYLVPRLNRLQMKSTIEGPVKLYKGKIAAGLTVRLLNDTQLVKDELPLLQHALMRIWDSKKDIDNNNIELNLVDYEKIGGIEKALSNHANEALNGMSKEELIVTKKIFQALTSIDENGRKIRRPVRLSELATITSFSKERLSLIINRFIVNNRNFLIINTIEHEDDSIIDISHESLIRQWITLNKWIEEEAESAAIFIRLCQYYELHKRNEKDLLSGNELQLILQWYYSFKPTIEWSKSYNIEYTESIKYLKESEKEEKRIRLKKLRQQRIAIIISLCIILIISLFSVITYRNYIDSKKQLALNFWKSSQDKKMHNKLLDALHYIAEAAKYSDDKKILNNLFIDAETFLPKTILINTFPHKDIVNSAVFSKDGKWILTAANDGIARIFNRETGKLTTSFKHEFPIKSAFFSPDGTKIVTLSYTAIAEVWDIKTEKTIGTPIIHKDIISSAVISPDGNKILTSSLDGTVCLWSLTTGLQLETLIKNNAQFTSAAFSRDGKLIVTATSEGTIRVLDISSKLNAGTILENGAALSSVVFGPDNNFLLTASSDSSACVWNLHTGKKVKAFRHNDKVTCAVYSGNGKFILTGSRDKTSRLWDVESGKQIGTELKHQGPIYSAVFSNDGKMILTAGWDKNVRLWLNEEAPKKEEAVIFKNTKILKSAAFSPNDKMILVVNTDGTAEMLDKATLKPFYDFNNIKNINSAVFSSDGSKLLTANNDSKVRVWNVSTGKKVDSFRYKISDSSFAGASFNTDGTKILSFVENGKKVFIWDVGTRKLTNKIEQKEEVTGAEFSPDGGKILITVSDSTAYLIDLSLKKTTVSFKHENLISSAVFSPDGKSVLTASWDMTARVWDPANGKQVGPSMRHNAEVNSAAFSPDGNLIVTGGWDSYTHIWSSLTLEELGIPYKQGSKINTASFSSDNAQILTCTDSIVSIFHLQGDLDLPGNLFQLQAIATTGVALNVTTGETECIPDDQWHLLKEEYYKKGQNHYKICKYPSYNLWHRIYHSLK